MAQGNPKPRVGGYYRLTPDGKKPGTSIVRIDRIGVEVPIQSIEGAILTEDNCVVMTSGLDNSSGVVLAITEVYPGEINRNALERIRLKRLSDTEHITQINDFFRI